MVILVFFILVIIRASSHPHPLPLQALKLDALHSSHPIEVSVGHPSEVDEIFDNISYNKGASVIRSRSF